MVKQWRSTPDVRRPKPAAFERPMLQADLLMVESGLRESALVEVSRDELAALAPEFAVREVVVGPVRAGNDARLRADEAGADRIFAVVSRRSDLPPAAWFREVWAQRGHRTFEFDGRVGDAEQTLGALLDYPACCVEWYRGFTVDPSIARSNFRYAEEALMRTAPGRAHLGLNWLFHDYFHLVSHRPCSFSCEESIERATRFLGAIERRYPEFGAEIRAALGTHVLLFDSEDYLAFSGHVETAVDGTLEARIESIVRERFTDATQRGLYGRLVPGSRFRVEPGAIVTDRGRLDLTQGRRALLASFGGSIPRAVEM